jgi:hypothetical protein
MARRAFPTMSDGSVVEHDQPCESERDGDASGAGGVWQRQAHKGAAASDWPRRTRTSTSSAGTMTITMMMFALMTSESSRDPTTRLRVRYREGQGPQRVFGDYGLAASPTLSWPGGTPIPTTLHIRIATRRSEDSHSEPRNAMVSRRPFQRIIAPNLLPGRPPLGGS